MNKDKITYKVKILNNLLGTFKIRMLMRGDSRNNKEIP